jgi:TetR/AcrR family transcriptional regulator of autoinduction and epiphytic fitness
MEEVARAAGLSRQGLYLHFPNKEDLFRAALAHALDQGLAAATARLADGALSLEDRLTGAFEEWVGRYVGTLGDDVADLHDASRTLGASTVDEHERAFDEGVVRALRGSGLPAAYKAVGLTAKQLAETLHATARGLKSTCPTRDAFASAMRVAVRALCLPVARQSGSR